MKIDKKLIGGAVIGALGILAAVKAKQGKTKDEFEAVLETEESIEEDDD